MFVLFAIIVIIFIYAIINNQNNKKDYFDSINPTDQHKCKVEIDEQPIKSDDHTVYDNIHRWLDTDSKYGNKIINDVVGYSVLNNNQLIPIENVNIPKVKIVDTKNPKFEYINSIFTKNINQEGFGIEKNKKYDKPCQHIINMIKLHQPCMFDKPNYFKIGNEWHYYDSRYPMYPINIKFLTNPALYSQKNYNQYPSYRYIMKY